MKPTAAATGPIAFVHVDVDDVWAVAACYGIRVDDSDAHRVYDDALARFAGIFAGLGIRATFFVMGTDLARESNAATLRQLVSHGHAVGNHSQSHRLDFRSLAETHMEPEVEAAERAIEQCTGVRPRGFRAPGYGICAALIRILLRRGYAYDSSIMPGPYGPVFRWLDRRITRRAGGCPGGKTQYSAPGDWRAPLAPFRIGTDSVVRPDPNSPLIEIPAATAPLLRLPFQAGVCMRLGQPYFDACLASFRRQPGLPLLFLLHGADLLDPAAVSCPFFRDSAFFGAPLAQKEAAIRRLLERILQHYTVTLAEEWITTALPLGSP